MMKVRVVKLMPDWIPGKQKGEFVNVKFMLPVKFKLVNERQNKEKIRRSKEVYNFDRFILNY